MIFFKAVNISSVTRAIKLFPRIEKNEIAQWENRKVSRHFFNLNFLFDFGLD